MKKLALIFLISGFAIQKTQTNWKAFACTVGATVLATKLYSTLSIGIKAKRAPQEMQKLVGDAEGVDFKKKPWGSALQVSNIYLIPSIVGGTVLGLNCLGRGSASFKEVSWCFPIIFGTLGATEASEGYYAYHNHIMKEKDSEKPEATIKSEAKEKAINASIQSVYSTALTIGKIAAFTTLATGIARFAATR